jgi:hypothetical protein
MCAWRLGGRPTVVVSALHRAASELLSGLRLSFSRNVLPDGGRGLPPRFLGDDRPTTLDTCLVLPFVLVAMVLPSDRGRCLIEAVDGSVQGRRCIGFGSSRRLEPVIG